MSLIIRQILKDVTFNILETMFFSLPEPYEEGEPNQAWDLCSSVNLNGSDHLTLRILLSKDLAMKLASDFLGREHDEITAEALLDMMKEMANMIGGNLITRLDSSTDLVLNIPESRFVANGDAHGFQQDDRILIQVGDRFMVIAWGRETI